MNMHKGPVLGLIAFMIAAFPGMAFSQVTFDFDGELNTGFANQDNVYSGKIGYFAGLSVDMDLRHRASDLVQMDYLLGGEGSYDRFGEFWGNPELLAIVFSLGKGNSQALDLYSENLFQAKLGRQNFSDATGKIIDRNLDGLRLFLDADILRASLSAGYLGWQSARSSGIRLSADDEAEAARAEATPPDHYFAPSRFVVNGTVELTGLIAPQLVGLQGGAQVDLREPPYLESYTSGYFGVYSRLSIAEVLGIRADLSIASGTTVNGGTGESRSETGVLVDFEAKLTFPIEVPAYVALTTTYASGGMYAFTPLSFKQVGHWFGAGYSNIVALGLSTYWRPFAVSPALWLRDFEVGFDNKLFWHAEPAQAQVVSGVSAIEGFYGNEFSLGLKVIPVSDFRIEGRLTLFFAGNEKVYTGGEVLAALSF